MRLKCTFDDVKNVVPHLCGSTNLFLTKYENSN